MKYAFLLLILLTGSSTIAQTLQQLEQEEQKQQRAEKLADALKTIDAADASISKHTKARHMACMKSIGAAAFCGCLSDGLPWIFTFDEYVAITSKSKEANQYSKLPKDTQAAYDKVGVIRDKCVAAVGRK